MRILLFYLCFLFSMPVFAGGIKGWIKDEQGNPLSYATIFIRETGTGTVTNEEGFYEINLEPGEYTLIYQYLGYVTQVKEVAVGDKFKEENITLKSQALDLSTVEIYEGREDPAYTIMRKAIAKAGYHRQQLDGYKARVYIKGSGRLLKAPWLVRDRLKEEGIDSTTAFLVESVSEVTYKRPNIYKEKVISIRKQGNDNNVSPNNYVNASFYDPQIGETVSPLSPQAFTYYKFEFLGSYIERDYEINRIKVIPRSRGEGVFEGTISIVEDWWSIHSLQLHTSKLGIGVDVKQIYAPIQGKAWLPVTHRFDVDGSILGFGFEYSYLATAADYEIEINPELDVDFTVIDEKIEKELAEELEKQKKEGENDAALRERLASNQELTRKDLRKMIKEYEKEERRQREEPRVVENYTTEIDSNAYNRDTLFWESIRPVPLTSYEIKSYQRVDSLAVVEKEKEESGETGENESELPFGGILFGETYKLNDKTSLGYRSPLWALTFNTVEGYASELELFLRHRPNERNQLKFGIVPRYSFGRKKASGKAYYAWNYGTGLRKGGIRMEGGRYMFQLNEEKPITPFVNSAYTVLLERNYMKLFEKEYFALRWQQKVADNLLIKIKGGWEHRIPLENVKENSWIDVKDREFSSNIPFNEEIGQVPFNRHEAVLLSGGFEWTPWQLYTVRNGKKESVSGSPLLFGQYTAGLKGVLGSDVDYAMVEGGIKLEWERSAGSRLNLKVSGGTFLKKDSLALPDFRHFPGNQTIFVTSDPVESFRLLDYYRYSTKQEFVQGHAHYQFRKLLFTQIPELWLIGLKENLFVNYLWTPSSDNYFEAGYSLDNILKVLRLEVAFSFQDLEYRDFGFLIGISSAIGTSITGDLDGDDGESGGSIRF